MGTTFQRIGVVVSLLSTNEPQSADQLAATIRGSRARVFKVRGDGTSEDDFMSPDAMARLITLCDELALTTTSNNAASLTAAGRRCAEDQARLAAQVRSSVDSALQGHGIDRPRLQKAIARIRLPRVPDAQTVFDELGKSGPKISLSIERFRTLMFLSACADGFDRVVKVHYVA